MGKMLINSLRSHFATLNNKQSVVTLKFPKRH